MWQKPAWGTCRGYTIAGSPPPDFGGSQMIEAFMENMLQNFNMEHTPLLLKAGQGQNWHMNWIYL